MTSPRALLIAATLLVVTGCDTTYSSPSSPTPATPPPAPVGSVASVTIPMGAAPLGDRAYTPDTIDVPVGSTVTWVNTDTVAHTSTSDASGWDSGTLGPQQQFSTTLQIAGTFAYHCAIHPGMVGIVTVR